MQITPNILLYSQPIHSTSLRLQAVIGAIAVRENIIVVQNMKQLIRILRQPLNGVVAAVLLAGTKTELMDLMPVRDLLLRIPSILILPDHEKETITRGHSLRPRYLTYADGDLSDVGDVFKKIVFKAYEERQLDTGGIQQSPV